MSGRTRGEGKGKPSTAQRARSAASFSLARGESVATPAPLLGHVRAPVAQALPPALDLFRSCRARLGGARPASPGRVRAGCPRKPGGGGAQGRGRPLVSAGAKRPPLPHAPAPAPVPWEAGPGGAARLRTTGGADSTVPLRAPGAADVHAPGRQAGRGEARARGRGRGGCRHGAGDGETRHPGRLLRGAVLEGVRGPRAGGYGLPARARPDPRRRPTRMSSQEASPC